MRGKGRQGENVNLFTEKAMNEVGLSPPSTTAGCRFGVFCFVLGVSFCYFRLDFCCWFGLFWFFSFLSFLKIRPLLFK